MLRVELCYCTGTYLHYVYRVCSLEGGEGGGVERVELCEELDGTREGGGA